MKLYPKIYCLVFVWVYGMSALWCAQALSPQKVCALHTSRHERLKGIPRHLLAAISKVESGHYDKDQKEIIAWPWTINAEGKGFRFKTKHEAVTAVRKMQQQGIHSIDVGCMQVNLYHHKNAFRTLEDAFDPRKNVDYAARFLTDLKESHKTWTKAVAHYHSATPRHHRPYRKKVYDTWRQEQQHNKVTSPHSETSSRLATFRERAKAKSRLIKVPDTIISIQSHHKKSPHWSGKNTLNPLGKYRARAQNALIHLSQAQNKKNTPGLASSSQSPPLLASSRGSNPTVLKGTTLPPFPKKRYASVREQAQKRLKQSKGF